MMWKSLCSRLKLLSLKFPHRERQIYHLYVDSKKNDTNGLIYKTETDSQRMNLWLTAGEGGEGIDWELMGSLGLT